MPIYVYKAKKADGKTIKGTMEANDENIVLSMLRERGYYPISVKEQSLLQKDITFSFKDKVKLSDMAIFCRQFSTLINSGINVLDCLDILRQQTENKRLKESIKQTYESVQKGNTLSLAMKEHKEFPQILLNMVEAGEASGTLDVTMERMAIHFEKENQIKHKVKTAMTYPIIIAIISVMVVIVLLTFVVPTFVSMFEGMGAQLPMSTRLLLGISSFITSKWYIILAILAIITILMRQYISKGEGRRMLDSLKLNLPVIGIVNKKIIASRFTRTLSTLLSSGLPLLTSLEVVTKVVGNSVIADGLEETQRQVSRGVSLAEPISEMNVFPPMVTNMIKIGEDSGSLEGILEKTADFYDGEVEAAVEQLTSLIEPFIIIIVAILVAFIVLSILQPIFGMYEGIGM